MLIEYREGSEEMGERFDVQFDSHREMPAIFGINSPCMGTLGKEKKRNTEEYITTEL